MPTSNQYPEYQPLVQSIRNFLNGNWHIDMSQYKHEGIYFDKHGDLILILFYNTKGSQIKVENVIHENCEFITGDISLCQLGKLNYERDFWTEQAVSIHGIIVCWFYLVCDIYWQSTNICICHWIDGIYCCRNIAVLLSNLQGYF